MEEQAFLHSIPESSGVVIAKEKAIAHVLGGAVYFQL